MKRKLIILECRMRSLVHPATRRGEESVINHSFCNRFKHYFQQPETKNYRVQNQVEAGFRKYLKGWAWELEHFLAFPLTIYKVSNELTENIAERDPQSCLHSHITYIAASWGLPQKFAAIYKHSLLHSHMQFLITCFSLLVDTLKCQIGETCIRS